LGAQHAREAGGQDCGSRTVRGQGWNMANALQERYAEMLLDRIRADDYPSATYMNMLEQVATPRVLGEYTQHLLERTGTTSRNVLPRVDAAHECPDFAAGDLLDRLSELSLAACWKNILISRIR
jgi:hypothetical protein